MRFYVTANLSIVYMTNGSFINCNNDDYASETEADRSADNKDKKMTLETIAS